MTQVYEWRISAGEVELRKDGDQPGRHAVGYAAVFDEETKIYGITEVVDRSAFTKTLKEADVRGLFNHDPNKLLGRTGAGTLKLSTDDRGLAYDDDLPETPTGEEVRTLLERRDLNGSSFGFRVIRDEWLEHDDGTLTRTLKEVALRDVGPVTFPAYIATDAALRSLAEVRALPFDKVHEAALAGDLPKLLLPEGGSRTTTTETDEGRTESTFIPKRSWSYA